MSEEPAVYLAAIEALLDKGYDRRNRQGEWVMGNGQCPVCQGVGPSFYPHVLHLTPDTIGHTLDCKLAAALAAAGGTPIMLGAYKPGPLTGVRALRLQSCQSIHDQMRDMSEETMFKAVAYFP